MLAVRKPELAVIRDMATGETEWLLTAAEVAKVLRIRSKRVYELDIPCVRISVRTLRWRVSDLARWIDSRGTSR